MSRKIGRFTAYNNAFVDATIDSHINIISKMVLQEIPNVISIILVGGFGRGEGSAEVTSDRHVMPLKDYDFAIVVKQMPKRKTVEKVLEKVYQAIKVSSTENELFRFSSFAVDLEFRTTNMLVSCDIWDYDFRAASQLLYGEDVRKMFRFQAQDIPLSSGLKLLFEKITGLIGHFRCEYLEDRSPSRQQRKAITYECMKTYVEMCTALCILAGNYRPTYKGRMKIFDTVFEDRHGELLAQLPHLPQMVRDATEFKLKPEFDKVTLNPIDLWFKTRDDLEKVLKYYIRKFFKISVSDWSDFVRVALFPMWQEYTLARTRYYLNRRFGIKSSLFVRLTDIIMQIYLNSIHAISLFRKLKKISLRQFLCACSPAIKLFLASILILFAINRDRSVRWEYLNQAETMLRYCAPFGNIVLQDWSDFRLVYLQTYKLYDGPK